MDNQFIRGIAKVLYKQINNREEDLGEKLQTMFYFFSEVFPSEANRVAQFIICILCDPDAHIWYTEDDLYDLLEQCKKDE